MNKPMLCYLDTIASSISWRKMLAAIGGLMLCQFPVLASNYVDFNIIGIVESGPACTVNANNDITVIFNGGVALETTSINGSNYATPVPFTLNCKGNPSTLRLSFQGTGSAFDSNVLATTIDDLGIKLLQPNGSALNKGAWFTFTYSATPPAIKAVPVKRAGAILPGGEFTSSATLLVEVL
ncbi:fimbrial protein [Klebsiella oxytoca]|uniref:fimbrial protein n=1 Tax=Klebsiella oxytoca TaxID=571 RepID=UPI00157B3D0E|nr:fimbrial protein [Klebsiella oxytoca]